MRYSVIKTLEIEEDGALYTHARTSAIWCSMNFPASKAHATKSFLSSAYSMAAEIE